MLRRIQRSLVAMYTKMSLEVSDFKKDESAMEVIQVVMLIAVGVLAISAVWAGVNGLLEQWWGQITGASSRSGPSISP